ncbi:hypothetical protein, partial [Limnohabitans sp.]|uniref:hypothetical protein n=1 Tax=Limnohabitans sp. TaxID=1907725 RepID=UPI00333FCF76
QEWGSQWGTGSWQGGWQQAQQQAPPQPQPADPAAKQAAKAKKRAAQKAKKVAAGVNPAEFTAGKVHLSDMRSAQRLWTIFPHDASTTNPVLKYNGGI